MHSKKEVTLTVEEKSHGHNHDHDHEKPSVTKEKAAERSNRIRLLSMLFMTFSYFLVEIVVGYITGSVALVADSFHMLSDVISLVIAYIAVRMSPKKWTQNTFGWARAEVLGALVNAVFLVALCFTIVAESLERFIDIKDIKDPKLILIVGSIGLLVNLIGLGLFHEHGHSHGGGGHGHSHGGGGHGHSHSHKSKSANGHSHSAPAPHGSEFDEKNKKIDLVSWVPTSADFTVDLKNDHNHEDGKSKTTNGTASATQMNMHGVFLHVLADALGSVIVIISALVIWLTDWEYRMYVDPLLSLLMVMLICASVWPLLYESAMVLLQTIPTHISIDDLKTRLLATVKGTEEVHEFHIWQLSGNRIVLSAHILCSCDNQVDSMRIGEEIKEFFHKEGIHSTTIQLEFANDQSSSGESSEDSESDISTTRSDCYLTCPNENDENEDCVTNSCCRIRKRNGASVTNNGKAHEHHNHDHHHDHDHDHDHDHQTPSDVVATVNAVNPVNTNMAFVPDAQDSPGVIEVNTNTNTDSTNSCSSDKNHSHNHSHPHNH